MPKRTIVCWQTTKTVTLTYQVRARFPIKAKTPLSRAHPYYNPERAVVCRPQELVVTQ